MKFPGVLGGVNERFPEEEGGLKSCAGFSSQGEDSGGMVIWCGSL